MNLKRSHKIHKHIAKIVTLVSTFHSDYGRDYLLTDQSPDEAWDLYREFMNQQANIANLLDLDALHKPFIRWEKWWEKSDVMSMALVHELAGQVLRLIEYLSCLEAKGESVKHNSRVRSIQEGIAGLLHPDVCRNSLEFETAS